MWRYHRFLIPFVLALSHITKPIRSYHISSLFRLNSQILNKSSYSHCSNFFIQSTNYSSGPMSEDTVVSRCTKKINDSLKVDYLKVSASNDDPNGSHIRIECVSSDFEGKNSLQRQRLIYKAIWDEMSGGPVHAVDSIVAKAPSEVNK